MGFRTSYIKTAHVSSGNSLSSFSRFGRRVLYHRNGVWLMVFAYQEKYIQKVSKFSPNIPPCRMKNFLMSNHYLNTSVQKGGILGFPGCLEHSQMIWNSVLSVKRDKRELHVIWLDLDNAYGIVPHHLIWMALDVFNFPSKVGEIIMKYFNSAFIKFTVKDYSTK